MRRTLGQVLRPRVPGSYSPPGGRDRLARKGVNGWGYLASRRATGHHRLPAGELPPAGRKASPATVGPEDELIEVAVGLPTAQSVVSAQKPGLDVADHPVGKRNDGLGALRRPGSGLLRSWAVLVGGRSASPEALAVGSLVEHLAHPHCSRRRFDLR